MTGQSHLGGTTCTNWLFGCLFLLPTKNAEFLKVLQIRVPKIDDFPSTPTLLVSGDLGHIFSPVGPAFFSLNSGWGMFPSSSKVGIFHGRYRIRVNFLRSNLGVTSFHVVVWDPTLQMVVLSRGKQFNRLWGDIHQPLHTANGYFNDASHGYLPYGDRGGNRLGRWNFPQVWSQVWSLVGRYCNFIMNWHPNFGGINLDFSNFQNAFWPSWRKYNEPSIATNPTDVYLPIYLEHWILPLQDPCGKFMWCQQPAFLLGFCCLWVPPELVSRFSCTCEALSQRCCKCYTVQISMM